MKLSFAIVAFALLASTAQANLESAVCSKGVYNGHTYEVYYYPRGTVTWTEARDDAAARSLSPTCPGHLVTITNQGEQDFVHGLLTGDDGIAPQCPEGDLDAWMGLRDRNFNNEGNFQWVTDELYDYENFCNGEPNNGGGFLTNEDFVEIWIDGNNGGCWNDNRQGCGIFASSNSNGCDNDKYVVEYDCAVPPPPDDKNPEGALDPHFKTWAGKWYDYMGECDLTFLHAPHFEPNMAMDIVIRTKIRYGYSYIENAIVKIGEDTLEVGSYGDYFLNGVGSSELSNTIAGFPVSHTVPSKHVHVFEIDFGQGESILVKTFKDMVSIKINKGDSFRYGDSKGLLGSYETGAMLSRNGTVVFDDPNEFAEEWQVRQDEPMLFHTAREPQHPQACIRRDPTSTARRLGESIALDAATKACAGWDEETRANCIHDVMATGDLELASAGAF